MSITSLSRKLTKTAQKNLKSKIRKRIKEDMRKGGFLSSDVNKLQSKLAGKDVDLGKTWRDQDKWERNFNYNENVGYRIEEDVTTLLRRKRKGGITKDIDDFLTVERLRQDSRNRKFSIQSYLSRRPVMYQDKKRALNKIKWRLDNLSGMDNREVYSIDTPKEIYEDVMLRVGKRKFRGGLE